MDLYIYYKVREADTASLQAAVVQLQTALAASHGVKAQLKRRPGASDGLQTWMEVYAGVPADFQAVLDAEVEQAGLSSSIAGVRHTEVFVDVSVNLKPCA
ncbi:MAG: DUF4936 family protein [Duganella sp.]